MIPSIVIKILNVKLKITIPRNTPVKLNMIEIRTINGFETELNWKTNNKIIREIAVKRAEDKNSWFSSCSFISPVNLKLTFSGVSNPLKAISAVLTIWFALEPAKIEEYRVTTLCKSICLIALNAAVFFSWTTDATGTSLITPEDWSLNIISVSYTHLRAHET